MFVIDPISDMLSRLRNAQQRQHSHVEIPFSNVKHEISKILLSEGYVEEISIEAKDKFKTIRISLKYFDGKPVVKNLNRISKPGRRVYVPASKVPLVNAGLGVAIISTSKGLLSDNDARKNNIGGEVICTVF